LFFIGIIYQYITFVVVFVIIRLGKRVKVMGKIMPLELLSSIRGATPSVAVEELFRVIREAVPDDVDELSTELDGASKVTPEALRNDDVVICPENERELIRKNFPREKNGYLVVPKVIEDQE
jgi:Asp-tRNA(Asn)/Glu-tRNA(Gln) amidotransferase C subunit